MNLSTFYNIDGLDVEWERTTPPPASSEVELESLPPLTIADSPASPDPQTPADDDTDDEYVDYCPYPAYPETPSATAYLQEQRDSTLIEQHSTSNAFSMERLYLPTAIVSSGSLVTFR